MKFALDSNIMIYAEGLIDDTRNQRAQAIIAAIAPDMIVIPLQSVSETLFWLVRKARLPSQLACQSAAKWLESYTTQAVDHDAMQGAIELVAAHQLQVFDAIILSCAAEAGAHVLLSEDMQHGFRWRGVTVVNPFLAEPHPLIQSLVSS